MRHHPKSNNGVFSKKQRKASRFMMAMRQDGNFFALNDPAQLRGAVGLVSKMLGMAKKIKSIFKRKTQQKKV